MLAAHTNSMPTTFPAAAYTCHAHGVACHVSSTREYGVTVMKIVDTARVWGVSRLAGPSEKGRTAMPHDLIEHLATMVPAGSMIPHESDGNV
jgi:hypothetical protein